MKLVISHKRAECIGCNACVEIAPSYWKMDTDGRSMLKDSTPKQAFFVRETFDLEDLDVLKESEAQCPMRIIHLRKQ